MTPSPLNRKLGRDLWRLKWQVLAIALLIACGVSVGVMAFSAEQALVRAQADFYHTTRFADVFATARRAPLSRLPELRAIQGVTDVDARIVESGLMDVPGLSRPATARLISLPDNEPGLNGLSLVRGRMPAPDRTGEVVALNAFLQAAHVEVGQTLTAIIGGQAFTFTIVGAVLSPEYVYAPAPQSFMPDDAHQAMLWAPRRTVERASGLTGAFNSVALAVAPGVRPPAVMTAVDRILDPYGGRAAYARADQPSHAFLQAELKELSTSATILPPVFLLVAAGLVHLVVSRMVDTEREQIGLLKAFGYGDWAVATPYLKLAGLIGVIGALAGAALGGGLGLAIIDLYKQYFRFPVLQPTFDLGSFALASAIAIRASLAGAAVAVRRAMRLSPAVAMQPLRPMAFHRSAFDRLMQGRAVDEGTRMILRNLQRFPARSAFACIGLAASLALLIGTQFLFDSLEVVIDHTYFRAQRWDEAVSFIEPRGIESVQSVLRLPGVVYAEPVRVVAARLHGRGRERLTRVVGLEPDARLQQPLDSLDRPAPPPGDGVVLSEVLAERLGVHPGDRVGVQVIDGRGVYAVLPVTGLARDYSGMSAYMDRSAMNRLLGDGDLASGAQLLVASDARPSFYRAIEHAPQISGASSRGDTVAAWRQVMAESFQTTLTFYVAFAAAIAFGIAFNTSRITLSERARDLATLRVLGFGQAECAYILAGELLILTLIATPIGVLGGQAFAHGLVAAYSRDEVRMPAIIGHRSYGLAILAYLAAIAAAGVIVVRRVWALDLVQVLKTRE